MAGVASHIQILRGNLAPDGAVAKITSKEELIFTGAARVYDMDARHEAWARLPHKATQGTQQIHQKCEVSLKGMHHGRVVIVSSDWQFERTIRFSNCQSLFCSSSRPS